MTAFAVTLSIAFVRCVEPINEHDLAYALTQPDPVSLVTLFLGVCEMGPDDHILTEHEAAEYMGNGDVGAARALIQHAKARREHWARRRS